MSRSSDSFTSARQGSESTNRSGRQSSNPPSSEPEEDPSEHTSLMEVSSRDATEERPSAREICPFSCRGPVTITRPRKRVMRGERFTTGAGPCQPPANPPPASQPPANGAPVMGRPINPMVEQVRSLTANAHHLTHRVNEHHREFSDIVDTMGEFYNHLVEADLERRQLREELRAARRGYWTMLLVLLLIVVVTVWGWMRG